MKRVHQTGILYEVVNNSDLAYIRKVSNLVFTEYTGDLQHWDFKDSNSLWKIHLGPRSGVVGVQIDGRCCCVKLFYDNRPQVRLRNSLGYAKARRAFRNGVELQKRGLACPRMLGYVLRRQGGLAMIVTELADSAERIDLHVQKNGATKDLATGLGRFIRQMHDSGVFHIDLSPRNLLAMESIGGYEFLVLDYEDARFRKKVVRKKRLENLHHLNERAMAWVQKDIRREFLISYLGDENDAEPWCGDLEEMIRCNPSKYTAQNQEAMGKKG